MDNKDKEFAAELMSVYEKHNRAGIFHFVGEDKDFKMLCTPSLSQEDPTEFLIDFFEQTIENLKNNHSDKSFTVYKQGKIIGTHKLT